jgi:LmbE family N-acetylglucosaminyl deacetylase
MTTLFLLAHQDDEIGVFHKIAEAKRASSPVLCIYMTNGVWAGVGSDQRNSESLKSLNALAVLAPEVSFLGTALGIPDGRLVENLERCFDAVCKLIDDRRRDGQPVTSIVMHAWEGGHQDHDAGYLLGLALANRYDLMRTSRQFPLYRRPDRRWALSFATPLESNGPVETELVPVRDRLRYLRLLVNYRSQTRVIMKLFPHIVIDYLRSGRQKLQSISIERVHELPNARPMLYEIWKLYTHAEFCRHAHPFIGRHIPTPRNTNPASERTA